MRRLTYFVACTADGFIAREDGSFDFFPTDGDHLPYIAREYPETIPAHLKAHFGASGDNRRFDAVMMGRRTYEAGSIHGLLSPYPHLEQFVVSSTMAERPHPDIHVVNEDPVSLVRSLKQQHGLGIWLCGGASLAGAIYDEIDDLVLKVNPVMLGAGMPLFGASTGPTRLELMDHLTFTGGVAIHHYRVVHVGARHASPPR